MKYTPRITSEQPPRYQFRQDGALDIMRATRTHKLTLVESLLLFLIDDQDDGVLGTEPLSDRSLFHRKSVLRSISELSRRGLVVSEPEGRTYRYRLPAKLPVGPHPINGFQYWYPPSRQLLTAILHVRPSYTAFHLMYRIQSQQKKGVWASRSTIGADIGVGVWQVTQAINTLAASGLITRLSQCGGTYRLMTKVGVPGVKCDLRVTKSTQGARLTGNKKHTHKHLLSKALNKEGPGHAARDAGSSTDGDVRHGEKAPVSRDAHHLGATPPVVRDTDAVVPRTGRGVADIPKPVPSAAAPLRAGSGAIKHSPKYGGSPPPTHPTKLKCRRSAGMAAPIPSPSATSSHRDRVGPDSIKSSSHIGGAPTSDTHKTKMLSLRDVGPPTLPARGSKRPDPTLHCKVKSKRATDAFPDVEDREVPPVDELITMPATAKDARPRCRTSPEDKARAVKLREFGRTQGWGASRQSRNWEEAFALLVRSGAAPERVDVVLDWYIGWYADGKKPRIRDGREFRAQFNWLCDLYDRESTPDEPDEMSEDAADIYDHATRSMWPKGAEARLPAVIIQSLNAMTTWYDKLDRARLPRDLSSARDTVLNGLGGVTGYLREWFANAQKRAAKWDKWSGDLGMYLWRPDHETFVGDCKSFLSHRGSGSGEYVWRDLCAALRELS